MATLGRSTRLTRDGDLPDPCGEARQLRRMVQGLTDTIEDACENLNQLERGAQATSVKAQASTIHDDLQSALDRAEGSQS